METQSKKTNKDCPPEKPLYNPKTKRCIKDTNANRKRIELVIKDMETTPVKTTPVKTTPVKTTPVNLKISQDLEDLPEIEDLEELEDLNIEETPKKQTPKKKTPKQQTPKQQTPKQKTPKKKLGKITLKLNTLDDVLKGLKKLEKKEDGGVLSEKDEKNKNKLLNKKEIFNREALKEQQTPAFLFPNKDDSKFNVKLIEKKEFNVLKKPVITDFDNLENLSEEACNRKIFELLPHQVFVKNFLSFQTPYNSLLLYHGLGTGKTCSAISICEEMRDYLKQMDIDNRIIIIASPNVQENFKLQLTSFNKLKNVKGIWDLNACVGNKFLKEINPMNMKGLTKEEIKKLISNLIKNSYIFMGYEQFSNYVERVVGRLVRPNMTETQKRVARKKALKKQFSNRLIVVDEVHNLRSDNTDQKKVSNNLFDVAKYSDNLKLLLLSATPLFNGPREITWLLNLMNVNDGRGTILEKELFDKKDNLLISSSGEEKGANLLKRKINGYVSYLRGESPLSFPFKVFPSEFLNANTIDQYIFPKYQMNKVEILENISKNISDLVIVGLKDYQSFVYNQVVKKVVKGLPKKSVNLGFQVLNQPLEALNIVYPVLDEDVYEKTEEDLMKYNFKKALGYDGLYNTMVFDTASKKNFEYRDEIIENHGRIFSPDNIGKYSSKLGFFVQNLLNSKKGIVLVFSQFIHAGCIPIALALEEMGITRYKNKNLFKKPPTEQVDSSTLKPGNVKNKARYIMITGDKALSPNINEEIEAATNKNTNGERVKVIIISRTGTEGIDLNNIRQVHLFEPWYNNNRANQVVGRAVRNCSHKQLPLEERNVEIYKYGTILENTDEEAADMLVYRLAENKSKKIGNITRLMKETAIDCMLNKDVINTTKKINQTLSSGKTIVYELRDKPYSEICDYKETCDYTCDPYKTDLSVNEETYNEDFILMNIQIVITKIKNLFKDYYVLKKNDIIKRININNKYPMQQIDSALSMLVDDESNFIFDKLNRRGNLVNIGEYYMYQPIEITNKNISVYDRSRPLDIKHDLLSIKLPTKKVIKEVKQDVQTILNSIQTNLDNANQKHKIGNDVKIIEWFKVAGNAYHRIKKWISSFTKKDFELCVIQHMVDVMPLNNKLKLYNYFLVNEPENENIKKVKKIMDKRIIGNKYLILINSENQKEYFKKENNTFVNAKATDKENIVNYLLNNDNSIFSDEKELANSLNHVIGVMDYFKDRKVVFKRKLVNKKHTGSRCDQNSGSSIKQFFEQEFDIVIEDTKKIVKKAKQLCIDQEIIMRYFNNIKKDNKVWFFTLEETNLANQFRIYKERE